ncbi:Protein of unknown function [Seinonella peptonophila]|uniref:DUF2812 domain-containing protein n=1 Tax=Seinonella peptonophila TaxID=112248 RepID=A0A1M4XKD4_9BACL|nr:DUF2812 domain-containing protein [Seinonella peptonophila]SHE93959.1 Protein of unknown function [Seinonella peptonophila]
MSNTKYMINRGLAFSEEQDMRQLNEYAKQGWLLEGFAGGGFFFKLKKGTPQEVQYNLDYQVNVDEEYFAFFQEAGWKHICSTGHIHIFQAPINTKPIYSDQSTLIDKYEHVASFTGKYAFFSLLLTLLFGVLLKLSFMFQIPSVISYICIVLMLLSVVLLVFTGLPYLAYLRKRKKLLN